MAYQNAKSCVQDVLNQEAPDHWAEELATAEQALTEAQLAYVDVLDELRESDNNASHHHDNTTTTNNAKTASHHNSPRCREEAAIHIRELRQQLENAVAKQ